MIIPAIIRDDHLQASVCSAGDTRIAPRPLGYSHTDDFFFFFCVPDHTRFSVRSVRQSDDNPYYCHCHGHGIYIYSQPILALHTIRFTELPEKIYP